MVPNVILVTGSRKTTAKGEGIVWQFLNGMHRDHPLTHLMHGDCLTGVDRAADNWALANGVQPVRCPALWDYYRDAKAGPIRNRAMAALRPHAVVAFPGGTGTASMVSEAKLLGLFIIQVDGEGAVVR